jgi:hypothetical protein
MKAPEDDETRQARRAKKQRKKKERIPQHGKSLSKIYTNAVKKRTGKSGE